MQAVLSRNRKAAVHRIICCGKPLLIESGCRFAVKNLCLVLILCVLVLFAGVSARATEPPKPVAKIVRVLVRTETIVKLRALFAKQRTANPDIQQLALTSDDNINGILGLGSLHVTHFAPFAAAHSAVFEDVRERINPRLFNNLLDASSRTSETELLRISENKLSRWFTIEYSDSIAPERVVFAARRSSAIEMCEPVYPRYFQSSPLLAAPPNDPLLDSQYYLKATHTLEAWGVQRCDSTMVVATVDQGIEFDHPDLGAAVWHNPGEMGLDAHGNDKSTNHIDDDSDGFIDDWTGWDFSGANGSSSRNSPTSEAMHGHHVAGILAATGNNGIGIAGVAFGAKMIVLKAASNFFCSDPTTTGFQGILYAADHGAKVISCSWGGATRSQSEQDVVNYAYARNSIVVCSAGNGGSLSESNYPSAYDHAVSVGSLTEDLSLTPDSQPGAHVTACAPGQFVLSTLYPDTNTFCGFDLCGRYFAGGYGEMCGTSMATPQVAGALAIIRQHWPNATNRWAVERLRATCDPLSYDPAPGFNGRGKINVYRALTDAHAYSLRLERSDIHTSSGNEWMVAPDTAVIRLHARNILDTLPDAKIRIELIDPFGNATPYFHTATRTISVGSLAPGQSVELPAITIVADSNTPTRIDLLVRLWISDSSVGYTGDYDYVRLHCNPGFRTLRNNLTVSIGDNGSIGFRDATFDEQGDGFRWEHAPSSIRTDGQSVLLGGGLIMARDTDHVVDALGSFTTYAGSVAFVAKYPILFDSGMQAVGAYLGPGEGITGSFWDYQADSANRLDARIKESAWALPQRAANSIVLTYYYPHMPPTDIGLFMDWDFGDYGNRDSAWFDLSDSIMYAMRHDESGYPVAAMKLVTAVPSGATLAYYAMSSNSNDPGFGPSDISSRPSKWKMFQTNKGSTLFGDVAVLLGLHQMPAPYDGEMTYILALGESPDAARRNLKDGEATWAGTLDVRASEKASDVSVWPNPATGMVHINAGLPRINSIVSDMLGREVLRSSGADLDLSKLPSGVYDVDILSGAQLVHQRVVRE